MSEKEKNKYVSKKTKKCPKCRRLFYPLGNRQVACVECKPKLKPLPFRPVKNPIDVMLDRAEFERRSARAKEGWY